MYCLLDQTLQACDQPFASASLRYAVLDRLRSNLTKRGLKLLAFGLHDQGLRVVISHQPDQPMSAAELEHAARRFGNAFRSGLTRSVRLNGVDPGYWTASLMLSDDALTAFAWAHRAATAPGEDPLLSRWTSHRDLMGLRAAGFYDAAHARTHVGITALHALMGGRRVLSPKRAASRVKRRRSHDLRKLLAVSSDVLGVPNNDRRAFGLFVQLGRSVGVSPTAMAKALLLSTRRVRQLSVQEHPALTMAHKALAMAA